METFDFRTVCLIREDIVDDLSFSSEGYSAILIKCKFSQSSSRSRSIFSHSSSLPKLIYSWMFWLHPSSLPGLTAQPPASRWRESRTLHRGKSMINPCRVHWQVIWEQTHQTCSNHLMVCDVSPPSPWMLSAHRCQRCSQLDSGHHFLLSNCRRRSNWSSRQRNLVIVRQWRGKFVRLRQALIEADVWIRCTVKANLRVRTVWVDDGRVFCSLEVWSRKFDEATQRVDLILWLLSSSTAQCLKQHKPCTQTQWYYPRVWMSIRVNKHHWHTPIFRRAHGFTVTPIAQSFTVGGRSLSGGGWNDPQYGYCEMYLA